MRILVLPSLLLLAASAAAPPIPSHTEIKRETGEDPPASVETERTVGEAIYELYNYQVIKDTSSRLTTPLVIDVFAAKAHLTPDTPLVATTHKGVEVYCTSSPALTVMGQPNSALVCLRDANDDGDFDTWTSPDGPGIRRRWGKLKNHVGFEEQTSVEMGDAGGYRYELLYQGVSAGVVNVLYREYLDSLARTAFQQKLSYTLEEKGPTEVSFRSLRMTIYSADNNSIRYVIEAGLETPVRPQ